MSTTVKLLTVSAFLGIAWVGAVAQTRTTPPAHKGAAETTLIGISLFDSGQKLITKFGAPDEIQPLSIGGSGGGGAASGAGRGGPAEGGLGEGGKPGAASLKMLYGDPFDTGSTVLQMRGGGAPGQELSLNPNAGGDAGGEDGGKMGAGGGGGAGGSTQGGSSLIQYTRWVYNRNTSKYAFVLDKNNRVVQIEAIGLWNKGIRTRRGIGFGSNFASIIKKYNAPDGYEISGDTIVVRYLTRDRVAFKLQRVDPKKPQVVTGIVVAAGK